MDSLIYATAAFGVATLILGVLCAHLYRKNRELQDEEYDLAKELDRLEAESDKDEELRATKTIDVESELCEGMHVYTGILNEIILHSSAHGGFAGANIKLEGGKTLVISEFSDEVVIYEYDSGEEYRIVVEENEFGYALMEFKKLLPETVEKTALDSLLDVDGDDSLESSGDVPRIRRRRAPLEL